MRRLTMALACCARLGGWPAVSVAQSRLAPCSAADVIADESPTKLDSIGLRAARTEHYSLAYCILKRLDAKDPARLGIAYDLAVAAMETGHFAESTRYFARAEREATGDSTHDRWSLAAWMDGYGRVAFGDTAGARAVRARMLLVDPAHPGVTGIETYLSHFDRQFADARRPMRDRVSHGLRVAGSYAHIGDAFLAAGMLDSARAWYEQAVTLDTAIYPYDMTAICALRGDTAAALSWLERAIDQGWRKVAFTRFDPLLASLHDSPTFARLLVRDDSLSAVERRRAEAIAARH